mmetsp:Transcript_24281/g.45209  ORF Transcript_24281/g.45209 Transcript_24281/m.45209 type:complete len:1056 (+) Transcript_24281:78-3245(+)
MTIHFERPIGASADLHELEYISALHQTCPKQVRKNGSITAADIRMLLTSRYGVVVDEDTIKTTVMSGLGGGDSEEEIVDLMEVVSLLLIPTILKCSRVETDKKSPLSGPLPEGVLPPEPDLMKRILKMILEDVTGDAIPKRLDKELIARIFEAFGEMDLSRDEELHEKMIEAANPSGCKNPVLDLEAFANGLVQDIQEYDLKNEIRSTTNFDDVLLTRNMSEIVDDQVVEPSRELTIEDVKEKNKRATPLSMERTAQAVDSTSGNYRNKYLLIMLVSTVIITYFAYWYHRTLFDTSEMCPEYVYDYYSPWTTNTGTIACEIFFSILSWLGTFFVFSLFGLFFVGLGSVGNGVSNTRVWAPLVGLFIVVLLVVPAYLGSENVRGKGLLDTASLLMGIVVMLLHGFNFIVVFLRPQTIEKYPRLKRILRSSRLADRQDMKRAGQVKTNRMVKNALEIRGSSDRGILGSHFACGLHNFAANIDPVEQFGGFRWTWRKLMDNSIVDTYGVWFSDRLLSGNICQYIVSIYVLLAGIQFSLYVLEEYSKDDAKSYVHDVTQFIFDPESNQEMVELFLANFTGLLANYLGNDVGNCSEADFPIDAVETFCNYSSGIYSCDQNATIDYLCSFSNGVTADQSQLDVSQQLALLAASGFNVSALEEAIELSLEEAGNASVDSLYPSSEYMIRIPLIIGTATAFLTSVYLAVTFLPSTTSTILRLRCGQIPTMANEEFNKYRCAPDQVSVILGSMFWGCFLSSILVGGFVGVLVFISLWQATVYFIARVIALFIGVLAVALIRLCMLTVCRITLYRGMYRERPAAANISLVALEWANFSLSVGFILVRMIKIIIAACMFIGRIDTPLLAPKVGKIGGLELDNYPTIFMKDLLQHEAHRHPYLDTLSVMYLYKLRYRDSFGSKAGSSWRLLFVYALMPWMHKYRIQVENDMGFLLQGIVETTRTRLSCVGFAISDGLVELDDEIPESSEGGDDGSKIFRKEASVTKSNCTHLEKENQELRNQVALLMKKQETLTETIRTLEGAIGSTPDCESKDTEEESGDEKEQRP